MLTIVNFLIRLMAHVKWNNKLVFLFFFYFMFKLYRKISTKNLEKIIICYRFDI